MSRPQALTAEAQRKGIEAFKLFWSDPDGTVNRLLDADPERAGLAVSAAFVAIAVAAMAHA